MSNKNSEILFVVIPSTDSNGNVDHSLLVERTNYFTSLLNNKFGGSTTINGLGHWSDDNSVLISENVNLAFSVSFDTVTDGIRQEIDSILSQLAAIWSQYCILRYWLEADSALIYPSDNIALGLEVVTEKQVAI